MANQHTTHAKDEDARTTKASEKSSDSKGHGGQQQAQDSSKSHGGSSQSHSKGQQHSGTQGGTSEQHAAAGRQSHKNS